VKDENGKVLVSESANFETQRDAVARIGKFLAMLRRPDRPRSGIA
jgi:hypothetical protein